MRGGKKGKKGVEKRRRWGRGRVLERVGGGGGGVYRGQGKCIQISSVYWPWTYRSARHWERDKFMQES